MYYEGHKIVEDRFFNSIIKIDRCDEEKGTAKENSWRFCVVPWKERMNGPQFERLAESINSLQNPKCTFQDNLKGSSSIDKNESECFIHLVRFFIRISLTEDINSVPGTIELKTTQNTAGLGLKTQSIVSWPQGLSRGVYVDRTWFLKNLHCKVFARKMIQCIWSQHFHSPVCPVRGERNFGRA